MAYIGTSPSNGVRKKFTYTATANQTSFSGNDDNGISLVYVDTEYLDVYQNGVKLVAVSDYASTTGTSVVLTQGASVSDIIEIIAFDVFSVADTVSASDGGSFGGNVGVGGTLSVTGASTLTGALSAKGGAVFNEDSADVDFRVESNGNANMLFVDGGNDKVGIGTSSPDEALHIHSDSVTRLKITGSSGQGEDNGIKIFQNGVNTTIANGDNGYMRFYTNNTERMRIREGGAITTGTSQPDLVSSAALHQTSYTSASNWAFIYNDLRTSSGTSTIGKFYRNGSQVGSISSETNSVAYNTSSDHRLKENVDYTFDATTRLKQLKPARFNFIADADTTVDGFLAHEVQSVVPEAITGTHNEVDDDGNAVMQGIDQSKLVPLLVKTIQELEARITALENGE